MTSLDEVLARREERAALQAAFHARLGLPLLSLTLVTPGSEKDSGPLRSLMDRAEAALSRPLSEAGASVADRARFDGPTGPELLLAIGGIPGPSLKDIALALEEAAPWGRLLDADVLESRDGRLAAISREERGRPPRPCLVCERQALECIKLGRHTREDLAAAVARLMPDS
jgi:holo-ACP synthase